MFVQQILSNKPSKDVETIRPDATVTEAAQLLSRRKIGALIVSRDGKHVAGIISERDIVRELGERGTGCLQDRVASLMTEDVRACSMSDRAAGILTMMTEGRFRHMPVLVDNELAGVISIGDVVAARLAEVTGEKHALEDMIRGF